jgi:hypothetical protein
MNEFNLLDIYATKGWEYLLVVAFLIAFTVLAWFLSRSGEGRR